MEDLENKTLLGKDSPRVNINPTQGKFSSSIGLAIISAILSVSYFTFGIIQKSYPAFSQLNQQAQEPSSTVAYNGKIYASLGGGDVNGNQLMCQSDRFLIPPPGWEVAPADADSIGVTAAYPWDTHVNVMLNGCGYGTASYTKGALWNCGMLGQNGNAYSVNSCSLMILIRKDSNPIAPEPSSTVTYKGKIYASLGGGNVNGLQYMCQSDRFLIPPNGWEVAPDNADSIAVTAAYPWDTHVNVVASGCGYGTAGYTKGALWNCGMLGSNGAGGYKTNSCSLMVLIMKSAPPIKYAPEPSLMIQYKGYYYAALSGADPHGSSFTCQQEYLALPEEDGWEVTPDEVDSRAANTMHPWSTHVNVFSNGYGYGTGAWNVGLWNYNMLSKVGKGGVIEYKPNACSLQILIRKLAPTLSPTLFPIAVPTDQPVTNPTERPTPEPTQEPSKQPVPRPTVTPTFEPTKNPTFKPTANPSKVPTYEPSSSPINLSHPTHEPIPNPTMTPTKEPTHVPTEKPSIKPTFIPSVEPTKVPTFEPSVQPTKQPTKEPTKEPTPRPSKQPTFEPTFGPTLFPTYMSTKYPTNKPTHLKRMFDETYKPTPSPTKKPRSNPTLRPTEIPTIKSNPTTEPTYVQGVPTYEPSAVNFIHYYPTEEPTPGPAYVQGQPTIQPSKLNFIHYYPSQEPTPEPTTVDKILV